MDAGRGREATQGRARQAGEPAKLPGCPPTISRPSSSNPSPHHGETTLSTVVAAALALLASVFALCIHLPDSAPLHHLLSMLVAFYAAMIAVAYTFRLLEYVKQREWILVGVHTICLLVIAAGVSRFSEDAFSRFFGAPTLYWPWQPRY